jgi:hypothetical protein
MELYSATNKYETLLFAGKWMELENIILSEASQIRRAKGQCLLSDVPYRPNANIAIL